MQGLSKTIKISKTNNYRNENRVGGFSSLSYVFNFLLNLIFLQILTWFILYLNCIIVLQGFWLKLRQFHSYPRNFQTMLEWRFCRRKYPCPAVSDVMKPVAREGRSLVWDRNKLICHYYVVPSDFIYSLYFTYSQNNDNILFATLMC